MIDSGSTAWVLASTALVMLMTPGLALFYGGMVRTKAVLNVMMTSFVCLAVVGVIWVVYGYSLAFGPDAGGGLIGGFGDVGMRHLDTAVVGSGSSAIPAGVYAMFELMFAVITVALLAGAVAERTRFWPWTLFVLVWVTLVYLPEAHWVFALDGATGPGSVGGWIANRLHALDFAGGTAVEINSGASALALALVVGKRRGWPRDPIRPHNLPSVLLGAGLLWFGWFGFNAGSALGATAAAGTALVSTMTAGAAAVLSWLVVEQIRDGRPTSLGAASGAVAGLVGITPACAYVEPLGALVIGLAAGAICACAVRLKFRFGFDDSLDVVAVHGIGGLVGMLLIGLLASVATNPAGADGLLYGGGLAQLGRQAVAVVAVLAYSFLVTALIAWVISRTIGLRVDPEVETEGVDEGEHAESGYDFSTVMSGSGGHRPSAVHPSVTGSRPPLS
ncbi:ammonium transporter [Actinomycetospora sp.]|uniref:ammonium transporter n=1 Tax=Actinomycetospora sp. TaxID=1872135 RepID=UPI002F3F0D1A